MTLTVETGAGLADADSLVSLADFKAYQDKIGNDYSSYADAKIEEALRRASSFLSNSYRWQGYRSQNRNQALAWPRSGVVDQEGQGIDSDEIPVEITNATNEIAWRELVTPGTMNPDYTSTALVKSEKVGPLEVEYALTNTTADGARPVLLVVRDMVSQFLAKGAGSRISGASYRV